MKKIILIIIAFILITGCSKKNEFQKIYDVDSDIVSSMSYDEFLSLTESKTGVVFIGEDSPKAKDIAKIFCDKLCECDVNKAHFVKSSDIKDDQLLTKFNVEKLNYPIIVAYYKGELVGFYDSTTVTENLHVYIDDLIHKAYPTVCTEAC